MEFAGAKTVGGKSQLEDTLRSGKGFQTLGNSKGFAPKELDEEDEAIRTDGFTAKGIRSSLKKREAETPGEGKETPANEKVGGDGSFDSNIKPGVHTKFDAFRHRPVDDKKYV